MEGICEARDHPCQGEAQVWSLLLWGEGPQGHRIKPLITQH